MTWLLPFLIITAIYAVIVMAGLLMEIIMDFDDLKGVYAFYGLTLVAVYSIYAGFQILNP